MEFDGGLEDVDVAVLQELWKTVMHQTIELANETKDVVINRDSFVQFSNIISELNILAGTLSTKSVEDALGGSKATNSLLATLNHHLETAHRIVKDYKSGSRLRLLLNSHSMLSRLQDIAKDIANTISSFQLVNLDIALNLKNKMNQVIDDLRAMELGSSSRTQAIASEIETLLSRDDRNRENSQGLLEKIAAATGTSLSVQLVKKELQLLKQEKEEMELQKKQAEALQLSQLIQLLYNTEMVRKVGEEESELSIQGHQQPFSSFRCPLSNKMMTDPVAILCGHSFERSAIQEYFGRGDKKCPNCGCELEATDLTPNLLLRSSIDEWNHRDMDIRFQAAVLGINSGNLSRQKKALEEMQHLMEMGEYAARATEEGLALSFVDILKDSRLNAAAALKCLFYLAKYDDHQKEAIVEAGGIRRIVRHMCKGGQEYDALKVLLELSHKETLVDKIGNSKDCIPLLVSLLQNNNLEVSEKVQAVLCNISSNTHFVVKMAEAGHFQPFVARFNQGPQETRAWMAAALIQMPLKENNIKDLKDKEFIHNLILMLSSSSPACKSTCLKLIKKLLPYDKIVKRLLKDSVTIPYLIGLISYVGSEPSLKQEAAEILALLVGASKHLELQKYQGLQELQSKHNVSLLLQLVASTDGQTKIQFLHLLVELSYTSEAARNLIRTDEDAITHLFSSIRDCQPAVRLWAMKLIHCISEGHPDGVPLPPSSPEKETAIDTLAAIFTNSPDIGERSSAAGIISQLPNDDAKIDEILCKSEALKSIHEVICSMDDEGSGSMVAAAAVRPDTYLLENSLAALLRYTEPTKPELQRQLGKLELYPSLVRVLSRGSSLAKQRTAVALAQLSQSTRLLVTDGTTMTGQTKQSITPLLHVMKLFPNRAGCCFSAPSEDTSSCLIHGAACAARDTFCLVKLDAVKPLVQTLNEVETGVAEAALMALDTLLIDHDTLSSAIAAIVDSQGVVGFLQVLEKGNSSAKSKALDLFQKILQHTRISGQVLKRSESILLQLLHDTELKKKAALVLRQMDLFPDQSSYF